MKKTNLDSNQDIGEQLDNFLSDYSPIRNADLVSNDDTNSLRLELGNSSFLVKALIKLPSLHYQLRTKIDILIELNSDESSFV